MTKYLSKEEAYDKCKREGKFIILERVNKEKIESTVIIAEADSKSAEIIVKNIPRESRMWSTVYKLYYDALHELVEAFLNLNKIKIDNHQCLFAHLCIEHPELEFSWEFFEKIRTRRNGINYHGLPISMQDWKEIELQYSIYIKQLKQEIDKKLQEAI